MNKNQEQKKAEKEEEVIKPDPETLNTTDPQEHMEGPVSSLVKKTEEIVEENPDEKDEPENKEENGE